MSDMKLVIVGVSPCTLEAASVARENSPGRAIEVIELVEVTRFVFDLAFLDGLDPAACELFLAFDARAVNFIRTQLISVFKSKGFKMARLISKRASVPSDQKIGENSIIYPGVVITSQATIGFNTVVKAGCLIEAGGKLGNSVTLETGAVISAGATVGDNTTIGHRVVVGQQVTIGKQCEIMIPMTYVNHVPDKTFYAEGYDGPVRIVRF